MRSLSQEKSHKVWSWPAGCLCSVNAGNNIMVLVKSWPGFRPLHLAASGCIIVSIRWNYMYISSSSSSRTRNGIEQQRGNRCFRSHRPGPGRPMLVVFRSLSLSVLCTVKAKLVKYECRTEEKVGIAFISSNIYILVDTCLPGRRLCTGHVQMKANLGLLLQ